MRLAALAVAVAFLMPLAFSQTMKVKIVNRENNETEYNYVVPAHFTSNSNSFANCSGDTVANTVSVNCTGSSTTTGTATPAREVSYHVRGATFILELPDGRAVVVNCESKFQERFAGPAGNHRSCHVPLVDEIQADFHGDKAKLVWIVSLDGKKTQSETYKILAVLEKPKSER